jgi:hypothetical protein
MSLIMTSEQIAQINQIVDAQEKAAQNANLNRRERICILEHNVNLLVRGLSELEEFVKFFAEEMSNNEQTSEEAD